MKSRKFISLLLFVFSCAYAQGQTDTLKKEGDPTDPNCPCYNVQLAAEKEYQEMLMQQRKIREDSLLALHKKSKGETKKRMKQNTKRKKRKECPTVDLIAPRSKVIKQSLNGALAHGDCV